MMKQVFKIFFLWLLPITAFAQNYTISGYMTDAATGEELLYATVAVQGTNEGTTTNLYGFYSITLPKGDYTLLYSYLGMETQSVEIKLVQDFKKDVELTSGGVQLEEIVVKAEKENENVTNTEVSTITLDVKDAKLIPVLFGEQDILKTMQLLPGVSANSEGSSGFFVRGGDADQNLILLDEAPVYNASHLLGFFSVFNSDAFGGIGLIASRLTVEGPLQKDKGSVMVSGRRTYADLLARPFLSDDFSDLSLYFYDLNVKANYKISENDRLYFSGYLGRDVFGTDNFGFDWGNTTATLRWNHLFSDKLFSNTSLIYSDYDYGFKIQSSSNGISLSSGIYDYNLKQDYNWYINPENSLRFGFQAIYHRLKPNEFSFDDGTKGEGTTLEEQKALEGGLYVGNEQKVSDKLSLNYGLRLSTFSNIGAYTEKTYDAQDNILTQTAYADGEFYNTYIGLEPRANATYLLGASSSLKASYNRNYQYLHLLSNSNSGTPTDLWIASSPLVKPQIADQIAVGYFRNFKDNTYELSAEMYYKNLKNQVDFENGGSAVNNSEIESDLVFGKGRTYGLELYLKKKKGDLTGWISYTLAKSERQFDAVNNGDWFSARQDRTHDLAVVAMYQITPRLTTSASFVYYTGDAVTFPVGKYFVDGALVNLYGDRNSERMPDYHRLDLGLTYILKDNDKFYSDLSFSIYNAYNRKNAYSVTFDLDENGSTQATKLSLFGIVPSLTWNFNF